MAVLKDSFGAPDDYSITIDRDSFGLPSGRSDVVVQISDVMDFLRAGQGSAEIAVRELNAAPRVNVEGEDRSVAAYFPETAEITRDQAVIIRDNFIDFYRPNNEENWQKNITGDLIPVPDIAA